MENIENKPSSDDNAASAAGLTITCEGTLG